MYLFFLNHLHTDTQSDCPYYYNTSYFPILQISLLNTYYTTIWIIVNHRYSHLAWSDWFTYCSFKNYKENDCMIIVWSHINLSNYCFVVSKLSCFILKDVCVWCGFVEYLSDLNITNSQTNVKNDTCLTNSKPFVLCVCVCVVS